MIDPALPLGLPITLTPGQEMFNTKEGNEAEGELGSTQHLPTGSIALSLTKEALGKHSCAILSRHFFILIHTSLDSTASAPAATQFRYTEASKWLALWKIKEGKEMLLSGAGKSILLPKKEQKPL